MIKAKLLTRFVWSPNMRGAWLSGYGAGLWCAWLRVRTPKDFFASFSKALSVLRKTNRPRLRVHVFRGVLTLTWYRYMCLPFGALFREIWYSDRWFSSETKEPKLHKLDIFWANYCKKHPIWSKLGAFRSKMVYWWVGNLAKNWYRDSQIF